MKNEIPECKLKRTMCIRGGTYIYINVNNSKSCVPTKNIKFKMICDIWNKEIKECNMPKIKDKIKIINNNINLKKVWKLRMKLRTKAKKIETELQNKEVQSLKLNLETINVSRQIEYENGIYKSEKDEVLSDYSNACYNDSLILKEECIKRSKEIINNIIESDKIWIDAVIKIYGNINIEWIYNTKKNDYECKLENGEIYG